MVSFRLPPLHSLARQLRSDPSTPVALGLFAAGLLFALFSALSPAVALALGILLSLACGSAMPPWRGKLSGLLLRFGVVLLGFRMSFGEVMETGAEGLLTAAVTIVGTLGLGYLIGRYLGVGGRVSTLISAGTAICGGSAIAAVATVIGAVEGEIAVALGTVFVLNAAALYLFPALGEWLNLAPESFGVWAGIAIHDLSSVVGAATEYGPEALPVAITVKLSRTLWIIPLVLLLGLRLREAGQEGATRIKMPLFVLFFLLASFSRDWIPGVESVAPTLGRIAGSLLTAALFVIGTGICPRSLRRVGWKPMAQGILLWVFISGAALLVAMSRAVPS